jgi:hypothetical protein
MAELKKQRKQISVNFEIDEHKAIADMAKEMDLPLSTIVRDFTRTAMDNDMLGLQGRLKRDVIFYAKLYEMPVATVLKELIEVGLFHHNLLMEYKIKAMKEKNGN